MKPSSWLFVAAAVMAAIVNVILVTTNRTDEVLVGHMGLIQMAIAWLVWNWIALVLFAFGWFARRRGR